LLSAEFLVRLIEEKRKRNVRGKEEKGIGIGHWVRNGGVAGCRIHLFSHSLRRWLVMASRGVDGLGLIRQLQPMHVIWEVFLTFLLQVAVNLVPGLVPDVHQRFPICSPQIPHCHHDFTSPPRTQTRSEMPSKVSRNLAKYPN
jgi:hypothetical protein